MSASIDKPDALLDKLDNLMRSSHAEDRAKPPPVLTEALQDDKEGVIPTLVDAVEVAQGTPIDKQSGLNEPSVEDIVASRLVASVSREMAALWNEFAAHQDKLAVLHRSIKFALPQLVRLRWEESAAENSEPSNDDHSESNQGG